MAQVGQVYASRVHVYRTDTNGYLMGQLADPESPVAGTLYSPYSVEIESYTFADQTPQSVVFTGNQQQLGKAFLPQTEFSELSFTLSYVDPTLRAMANNTTVDTTSVVGATIFAGGQNQEVFNNFAVIIQVYGIGVNSTSGVPTWHTYAIPKAQLSVTTNGGASSVSGQVTNPNNEVYTIVPQISSKSIAGNAYSAYALTTPSDQETMTIWQYSYPFIAETYVADTDDVTFTATYKSTSDEVTTTGLNVFSINGTRSSDLSTVSTSTRAWTWGTGSTADDIITVFYPTQHLT